MLVGMTVNIVPVRIRRAIAIFGRRAIVLCSCRVTVPVRAVPCNYILLARRVMSRVSTKCTPSVSRTVDPCMQVIFGTVDGPSIITVLVFTVLPPAFLNEMVLILTLAAKVWNGMFNAVVVPVTCVLLRRICTFPVRVRVIMVVSLLMEQVALNLADRAIAIIVGRV